MLIWFCGTFSPNEVHARILDLTSSFCQRLVDYLESVHAGDFLLKVKEEVESEVTAAETLDDYCNPTETLPEPPLRICHKVLVDTCNDCLKVTSWWSRFHFSVNDLLLKSNVHKCSMNCNQDGSENKAHLYRGCLDNIWGKCKACFLHPIFKQTEIDSDTGHIDVKKTESSLNTFSYLMTYLLRCNTDVTSLHLGSAIKGVLLYVSNYVTKPALKTHVIFETIHSMFLSHSEMIGGTESWNNKACKLMTKIVNSLSAKMEMGSPMACMYLLSNPDHYTNYRFVPFYWQSYVHKTRNACELKQNNVSRTDQPCT